MTAHCYACSGPVDDDARTTADDYDNLRAALQAVLALADHWDAGGDGRFAYNRIAKGTAARAIRDAIAGEIE